MEANLELKQRNAELEARYLRLVNSRRVRTRVAISAEGEELVFELTCLAAVTGKEVKALACEAFHRAFPRRVGLFGSPDNHRFLYQGLLLKDSDILEECKARDGASMLIYKY